MTAASPYPWLALAGIVIGALAWGAILRRHPDRGDPRLVLVYLAALAGALLGSKLLFIAAEGWGPGLEPPGGGPGLLARLAAGKTILGALLGGYAAVEGAKKLVRYRRPTGDLFAIAAPLGLLLGRTGCLLHGCCRGVPMTAAWYTVRDAGGVERWPAVPAEMAFNAGFLAVAAIAWRNGWLRGQLFHVYLMAYGAFRFAHELVRDTPRLLGQLSPYHIAALAVLGLGAVRYAQRSSRQHRAASPRADEG